MNEIPKELQHPFFNDIQKSDREFVPFYYEQQYYRGFASFEPWQDLERVSETINREWQELSDSIKYAHQQRNKKEAGQLMVVGVAILVQYVYWLNEKPVSFCDQQIGIRLPIVPFNFSDRLQFIMQQPSLHLAFSQLTELMIEVNKLYAKKKIKKKHSK
ncbi:YpoC family protein [Cytobacillus sp. FSL K6-0265]|uniref:YpoC family protein n=1 Tax=Cytobacillus sp. FSL K6-0265 TaxID=2921448 RepID=UPI0030F9A055